MYNRNLLKIGIMLGLKTKQGLALLALLSTGLGMAACGETRRSAVPPSRASGTVAVAAASRDEASVLRDDEDEDGPSVALKMHNGNGADEDDDSDSNSYYDGDDENVLNYGHAADETDARAITAAIRDYLATAARGDGAAVCHLLTAQMVGGVVQTYGNVPGLPGLRGRTCATVAAKLLRGQHGQMSVDNTTVKVGVVRVEGRSAEVLLSFDSAWPNRYVVLQREGGVWKIAELFAGGLP
jgi:hypothetical protein